MTPIRPNPFPPQTPANPAADVARQAAQRAFFAAAMGRPAPPAATVQAAAPAPIATAAQPIRIPTAAPTEAPARIPRPGSILDIRV